MATGFDELVDHLLGEITLAGSSGLGVNDLQKAVREFYDARKAVAEHTEHDDRNGLLFSNEPPAQATTNVDAKFVDSVWGWCAKHPDIDVEQLKKSTRSGIAGAIEVDAVGGSTIAPDMRLVASEDRVWNVVAGHGVDHKRLPRLEFECLLVIAARKAAGVLQPDVVEVTGQDKRSVPKRTDQLVEKGYIIKETVLANRGRGIKTSLLKLKKYAAEAGEGVVFNYEDWFGKLMKILKDQPNRVAAYQDIRIGLGIQGDKRQSRVMQRCIRRLANVECVKRIALREQITPTQTGKPIRCLQLLRDPTATDRAAWESGTGERGVKGVVNRSAKTAIEEDAEDAAEDDDMEDEAEDEEDKGDETAEFSENHVAPQWTPDVPFANFLFNLVDSAGPEGITSLGLRQKATGMLWQRPLEETMLRLVEIGQTSQAPHLRHLTIIRNTTVHNKVSQYIYHSQANYEKALEQGLIEKKAENDASGTNAKDKKNPTPTSIPMDKWGFPRLETDQFANSNGDASLQECRSSVHFKVIKSRAITDEIDLDGDAQSASASASPSLPPSRPPKETPKPTALGPRTLAGSSSSAPSPAPKKAAAPGPPKKLGRPPKSRPEDEANGGPRKRGRPRKKVDIPGVTPKRGRPTKEMVAERRRLEALERGEEPEESGEESEEELSLVVTLKMQPSRLRDVVDTANSAQDNEMMDTQLDVPEAEAVPQSAPAAEEVPAAPVVPVEPGPQSAPVVTAPGSPVEPAVHLDSRPVLPVAPTEPPQEAPAPADATPSAPSAPERPTTESLEQPVASAAPTTAIPAPWITPFVPTPGTPKKKGRPTKAMVAERERLEALRRSELAKNQNRVVSLKIGTARLHDLMTTGNVESSRPPTQLIEYGSLTEQDRQTIYDAVSKVRGVPSEDEDATSGAERPSEKPKKAQRLMRRTSTNGSNSASARRESLIEKAAAGFQYDTVPSTRWPRGEARSKPSYYDDDDEQEGDQRRKAFVSFDPMDTMTVVRTNQGLSFEDQEAQKWGFVDSVERRLALNKGPKGNTAKARTTQSADNPVRRRRGRPRIVPESDSDEAEEDVQDSKQPQLPVPEKMPETLDEMLKLANEVVVIEDSDDEGTYHPFRDQVNLIKVWELAYDGNTEMPPGDLNFINHVVDQPFIPAIPDPIKDKPYLLQPASGRAKSRNIPLTPQFNTIAMSDSAARFAELSFMNPGVNWQSVIGPADDGKILSPKKGPIGRAVPPKKLYTSRKRKVAFEEDDAETPGPKDEPFKRKRNKRATIGFKDLELLVTALAVVRTLCGGVQMQRMSWDLVAHAMSFRYDGNFLRQRWAYFRTMHEVNVVRLQTAMREPFLEAYEDGELPPVYFHNLGNTDFPGLIEWVEREVLPLPEEDPSRIPDLPVDSAMLEARYKIEEPTHSMEQSKDAYFYSLTDSYRRDMALTYVHGTAFAEDPSPNEAPGSLTLLKSWCRAVAMTKQWSYNPELAAKKLGKFPAALIKRANKELIDDQILSQEKKDRQLPGRNYHLNVFFYKQMKRWPEPEYLHLRQIAAAHKKLAAQLAKGDMMLSYHASDAESVVLLNLTANNQIIPSSVLPERNDEFDAPYPRLTAWGYTDFSYRTKAVDKSRLTFPIRYKTTPKFTAQHALKAVPVPMRPSLVVNEPGARIPFWVDIHGNLLDDAWDIVLRSMLHLIVFRPGVTLREAEKNHKGKLGAWELRLVLEWMEEVGAAERFGAESVDEEGRWSRGWKAAEWWFCTFDEEIATWRAPAGDGQGK